ncbi:MAG: ArgE/DapE family deacylase [Meiothermus sp.]|nr:ArgE/DapE family deacylase [Meiothermus sp.]
MNPTIRSVLDRIEADRDFVIGLTQQLVRIPTVNPKFEQGPGINREPDLQNHLEGVLKDLGMQTEQSEALPGRPNLVGRLPGSNERSLILNGHIDVVPVGEQSRWTMDPFGGEIVGNRLYGRGSIDMKAGVAANVAAVKAIREAGLQLEGRLELHSVVDEEAGGFGTIDLIKRGHLAAGAIVTEPTWGAVLPAEGGLEWCRVTITGKSAHSAWRYNEIFPQHHTVERLEPGTNAILLAARFLEALQQYELDITRRRSHPLVPAGLNTINVGVIRGGSGRGPDGLPAVMTNPAIIPDTVVIDLDMKFLPQETSAEYRAEFESFVHHFAQTSHWLREHPPQLQWELGGLHFPPMNTPVEHPLVSSVIGLRKELGLETAIKGFEAVADAAFYAGAGMPVVIYGPGGDGFHGYDEYVDIESLVLTTKVVAASVLEWCGVG